MCRTKLTTKKKAIFLERLAECGNITQSCNAADIARRTIYDHKRDDAEFATAWDEAVDTYIDKLEAEADRRAHDGLVRKKFLKNGDPIIDPATGKQYEEREYSDTLLIFRLKALKPDTYRENIRQEISGRDGGPIETVVNITVDGEPLEPIDGAD